MPLILTPGLLHSVFLCWRGADSNIDRCSRGQPTVSSTWTRRAPFANCKLVVILLLN
ncbi:hypothetical protein RchiOBHm_Chr7g0242081 [Rosa chinensis]|uniref:Uncharacterized protein n=1 Tax=Rosa chinensis TaxID=74649 RepID=A0A2P6PID4_ROSCH|nr:hypothetical protein RchiOBHm_Chr7g0242081 [Rosa chinensis]